MASQERNDSKAPQLPDNFREIKDIQLFFEWQYLPLITIVDTDIEVALPPYLAYFPEASVSGVFRPPAA